jgi:hypothetical protein
MDVLVAQLATERNRKDEQLATFFETKNNPVQKPG